MGWVWLALAIFMVVMLVLGMTYAFVHGSRAVHKVSQTASDCGDRVSAMQDVSVENDASAVPVFTERLTTAMDRYSDAHCGVIERKQMKHDRHVALWSDWNGGTGNARGSSASVPQRGAFENGLNR